MKFSEHGAFAVICKKSYEFEDVACPHKWVNEMILDLEKSGAA